MDAMWRLMWALPLVLMVGWFAALILKRWITLQPTDMRQVPRMSLRESLSLSNDTLLHLIEVDGRSYLVLDSSRQARLQPVMPQGIELSRGSLPQSAVPAWMRGFYRKNGR